MQTTLWPCVNLSLAVSYFTVSCPYLKRVEASSLAVFTVYFIICVALTVAILVSVCISGCLYLYHSQWLQRDTSLKTELPAHLWCLDVFHILLTAHKSVVVKLWEVVDVWTTTTITLSDFHSAYLSVFLTTIFFSFRGNTILSFLPLFVSKIFSPSVYLLYFLCLLYWSAWQNNKQIHFSDGLDASAYFPLDRLIL